MAHQFDTGFVVRNPAWHKLAPVLADYPDSSAEARTLAGLDWDPEEERIYELVGINPDGTPAYRMIEGYKKIKRSDTAKLLSVMMDSYTVVSNGTLFTITEALLEAGRQAGIKIYYETAGSLDDGRRVWALARMPERELPGDPSPHVPYMFTANSHDGSTKLRAGATDVRIVCANTQKLADQDAKARGTVFEFRHTKNIDEQIEDAKKALTGAVYQIDKVYDRARELLSRTITAEQRRTFVNDYAIKVVIENMGGQNGIAKRRVDLDELLTDEAVIGRVNTVARTLDELLESDTNKAISGTAYGLVQTAVEFEDWTRAAKNDETRFSRSMLAHSGMKRFAHKLVDEVTATA